MPKLKSKKSCTKRIKINKNGVVKHGVSFKNHQMSNKVGLFYSHLVMKKSVAFNLVKSKFSNNYHAGYYLDNQLT